MSQKPENFHLGIIWRARKAVYGENSGLSLYSFPQEDLIEDVGELYDYMTLIEKFFADAIRFEKIKDDITLMYDITGGNGFEVGYKKCNYTAFC